VPEDLRGTYRGLAHSHVIRHIKSLGVTGVELMPIHTFVDDSYLEDKGLKNYWGYSTLNFFSAARRYANNPAFVSSEFKEMVARFHDADLEVILDVVYNHTAEGNELGPTLSFKGIDNATYYRLAEDKRYYINDTGTGNTVNLSQARTLQMVTDSLRYWAQEMHVDGFRFDLGTILAREPHGFDESSGFLDACRQDPILSRVKLIAEPWDCGPGGYQVGGFPPGWAEWNDTFRDTTRSFWKGEEGTLAEMATRLTASADKFNKRGRKPHASVNFITAHDGFTLNDLVSYNEKHNEANQENNQDGSSNNQSWNCGVEGPTDDSAIKELRERQKRNFLATLLLSQGLPMILAGDEFGRTQNGNNNAYCHDDEIGWVNWDVTQEGESLTRFVQKLSRLRRTYPILRRERFLTGEYNEELGIRDATWLTSTGDEMTPEHWSDAKAMSFGVILDGRAQETGIKKRGSDRTLYLILNAYHDMVGFTLPSVPGGDGWIRILDTNQPETGDGSAYAAGDTYDVTGRSVLLFELRPGTDFDNGSTT
jgi:isoamylase